MADIWNQIRKLDLYPKTLDEFRVKTYTGGILGLTCIVVMIALFIGEYSNYLYATEIVDHLNVNTSHYAHVKVDFDISFPRIPCKLLSLDSFDESGAPQKHIRQHVYKHRLNEFGMLDSSTQRQEVQGGETVRTEKEMQEMHEKLGLSVGDEEGNSTERNKDPSYIDDDDDDGGACGDCYGAGVEGQCCNTCDEVRQAYEIAGWLFRAAEVKQCEKEIMMDTLKDALAADGGCQIYGWIELSRSSGHFHIAPHKDIHHQGINNGFLSLLDLISFTFEQFNITHTINTLSFGDTYPGIKNPLDEQKRVVQDTHGMYQYYLKIVPTQYHDQTCEESQKKSILPHYFRKKSHHHKLGKRGRCKAYIDSNQYSVTEHVRHLAPNSGRGLPGVYFYYEMSPVQAIFEVKHKSFGHFITACSAILGGVYTVVGMVDGMLGGLHNYVKTGADGGLA